MAELLNAYPQHFGWRVWHVGHGPRLVSPYERQRRVVVPGGEHAVVDARCPHGNTVPAEDCPCGVHFFRSGEEGMTLARRTDVVRMFPAEAAVTFGIVPRGRVIADMAAHPGIGQEDSKRLVLRGSRYRVLAILAPEQLVSGLRQAYPGCSVLPGIINHKMRAVEDVVRRMRGRLDEFDVSPSRDPLGVDSSLRSADVLDRRLPDPDWWDRYGRAAHRGGISDLMTRATPDRSRLTWFELPERREPPT
ncbi:hypothetical protein [Mycolicibacterium porcinum]|uniref:Uncharacterized protein n=1 Tax=Mycolicibacterium porcinum TaxID=39693 RepID=A0ABV3VMJ9_9MYCO